MTILALDPEKVKTTRVVNLIFPGARLLFKVTTKREFKLTVDQFFGQSADSASVGECYLAWKLTRMTKRVAIKTFLLRSKMN